MEILIVSMDKSYSRFTYNFVQKYWWNDVKC